MSFPGGHESCPIVTMLPLEFRESACELAHIIYNRDVFEPGDSFVLAQEIEKAKKDYDAFVSRYRRNDETTEDGQKIIKAADACVRILSATHGYDYMAAIGKPAEIPETGVCPGSVLW